MDGKNKTPQSEYSVDEILAEAHIIKDSETKQAAVNGGPAEAAGSGRPAFADEVKTAPDETLKSETGKVPAAGEESEGSGGHGKKKKKKGLFSFFRRSKEYEDDDEEDDLYYGLQLKPLSEYRKEYENTVKIDLNGKDGSPGDSDAPENMDETFRRIHEERRKRLERIMEQAGVEPDDFISSTGGMAGGGKGTPPKAPADKAPQDKPQAAPPERSGAEPVCPPANQAPPPRGDEGTDGPRQSRDGENGQAGGGKGESGESRSAVLGGSISGGTEDTGTPPPVKEPETPHRGGGQSVPPVPVKEPETIPRPHYKAKSGLPVRVVSLDGFEEILRSEALRYPCAGPGSPAAAEEPAETAGPEEPPSPPLDVTPADDAGGSKETLNGGFYDDGASLDNTIEFPGVYRNAEPEKAKKHFRIFGDEEPESPVGGEADGGEEELDDYTKPEDAPSIINDIAGSLGKLFVRLIALGIISVLMLVSGFAYEYSSLLPAGIHNVYTSQTFLIMQLIFLFTAAAFCFPTISGGLKGIFKFKINADSAVSAAVAVTLVQNAVLLVHGMPSGSYSYSVLAVCALFMNLAGKFSMEKRIMKNFKYISSPGKKYAVQLFDDHNTALKLAKGCVLGEPKIAYETPAGFLKNFLRFSYMPDPGEKTSQSVGAVTIIASLALCAAAFFIKKDAVYAVDALAAAMCAGIPFMNTLSVNLPVARLGKTAARCGSMAAGWHTVEHFSETNAVMLDDKDLFPKGTIVLNGIKTFGGQSIDDAILDATALACVIGGPLGDVFDQIIKNKHDILPKVSSVVYIDGLGVTGLADGKRVLVGNGSLMKENGIEPPSRDYERKYIQSGRQLIYLACANELTAMFIVSYHSDRQRAMELKRMENNGVSLIVRTRDPNITPVLISRCFGLSVNSVNVLSNGLGNVYAALQAAPPERIDAVMATKGRVTSMMRLLTACIRQRGNISIAVVLQNTGAILGLLLAALSICVFGLKQLSVTSLFLIGAFWAAAVAFIPRLRRP